MSISPQRLQMAVSVICSELEPKVKLAPPVDEPRLWWELSCCVLSSQVPYGLAAAAADAIAESGFFHRGGSHTPADLLATLQQTLMVDSVPRRYRFPASRSRQLFAVWSIIQDRGGSLLDLVRQHPDPEDFRMWVVRNLPGLGPKQASMFLRNIGSSYELAILDRHVLRYMVLVGLLEDARRPITTLPTYCRLESTLRRHARDLEWPVGLLDWAVWIVMRAATSLEKAA